ncbi:MAG TPA: tetratricopeptide repeat protein [Blastocatellia bacterium]|nr:tetratricopeptide repeat protein [Blastocatellia bacterium]
MRFFDWLFGKQRGAPPQPSRPKVLAGLDDDSLQVLVEMGNSVVVMDREQYDYLYGETSAPDPAQRDLDNLLPKVTRVRALASGMFRGQAMGSEAILDTSDAQALTDFRKTLRIVEDPRTFSHCSCLGGPTLELFSGQELIATIGLQHGRAIRWKQWKHDANLCNGLDLNDWLTRYGVDPAFLDVLLNNQYDAGGMMPLGLRRSGSSPLSRAEQRIRLVELGRVRGGDLEAALAECQKALDAEPDLAFAYAIRALIHSQRQDHTRCVADCAEAIRLGLREADVYFARAVAQDNLGQPQDALADCTAALEIEPGHANAFNSRGLIRTRLGLLDEALADFAEAIRLVPNWGLPYLNRGQAHIARNDLDAAIADYDRVIALLNSSEGQVDDGLVAAAYANRGQVYRLKGNEARAAADLQEAKRLSTNPPRPW